MKFSWVTILQGVEFSIFPIDFKWALQQCSATALPVITLRLFLYFLDACYVAVKAKLTPTAIHYFFTLLFTADAGHVSSVERSVRLTMEACALSLHL